MVRKRVWSPSRIFTLTSLLRSECRIVISNHLKYSSISIICIHEHLVCDAYKLIIIKLLFNVSGVFFYLKMYIRSSYIFSWKLLSLVQSPGLQCLVGFLPAVFLTHFFSSLIIYFTLFSSLGPFKSAALLFVGVIVKLMHCLGNSQ